MPSSGFILALFLVTQAWDGIFTYAVVRADGVVAEGNVLLATWMQLVGPEPALLGAKLLAACCGVMLYARGIRRTLACLTVFYVLAAILPWLFVLYRY